MARILIELRVEMEGGATHEVMADQRDVAKWEIQDFGCPFNAIGGRPHLALRWLGWSAMRRRGLTGLGWSEFDEQCVEVADPNDDDGGDIELVVGDPDPGLPVPSEGTSFSSPGAPGSH